VGVSQADAITTAECPDSRIRKQTPRSKRLGKKTDSGTEADSSRVSRRRRRGLCEDEHRIGLQPVSRRIWVEEGATSRHGQLETSGYGCMALFNLRRGDLVGSEGVAGQSTLPGEPARMSTPSCLVES
jgi:hypothetical protein